MKTILALSILISINVFAAELSLTGGESATIQANTRTTVTCNGSSQGNQCSDTTNGLKTLVEACKSNFSPSYCIDKYWPSFKANNPSCVMAALPYCIDQCKTSFTAAYCADKCSK